MRGGVHSEKNLNRSPFHRPFFRPYLWGGAGVTFDPGLLLLFQGLSVLRANPSGLPPRAEDDVSLPRHKRS